MFCLSMDLISIWQIWKSDVGKNYEQEKMLSEIYQKGSFYKVRNIRSKMFCLSMDLISIWQIWKSDVGKNYEQEKMLSEIYQKGSFYK